MRFSLEFHKAINIVQVLVSNRKDYVLDISIVSILNKILGYP